MAKLGMRSIRLLGFAPLRDSAQLATSLANIPGPPLHLCHGAAVVAVAQDEPRKPLLRRDRKALLSGLQTVQRRLEVACQAGPFLPMDPSAACCPPHWVASLLASGEVALSAVLADYGRLHQWEIVLRWSPETVVAEHRAEIATAVREPGAPGLADAIAMVLRSERACREALLIAALVPAVVAFAPGGATGSDGEVSLTVLSSPDRETAIESALQALDAAKLGDASLDMRGPLPPVSFAAVRLVATDQSEISTAWSRLELPTRISRTGLHQTWRQRAAAAHPDRYEAGEQVARAAVMADLTAAYHVLRDLIGPGSDEEVVLSEVLRRAGPRLVVPPPELWVTRPLLEAALL